MIARFWTILLFCCTVFGALAQNGYVLDFYRVEVPFWDKKYMDNIKSIVYKYNKTQTAFNFSFEFKLDFANDLEVNFKADKFVNNAYHDFPIKVEFNLCEGLKQNQYGMADFYKYGNYPKCPMVKGSYYVVNWCPDASKFPPFLPSGKYRSIMAYVYRGAKISVFVTYIEVTRSLNNKRKNH